jgi:hypothetical protein
VCDTVGFSGVGVVGLFVGVRASISSGSCGVRLGGKDWLISKSRSREEVIMMGVLVLAMERMRCLCVSRSQRMLSWMPSIHCSRFLISSTRVVSSGVVYG